MTDKQHKSVCRFLERVVAALKDDLTSSHTLAAKIVIKRQVAILEEVILEHKLAYYQLVEGAEPTRVLKW